ncbi:bifunctional serine/threonine-protein kinase/ABC transporter substrate-binding protein [Phormidium sp. CCY1219]|uniref:bifunctional serine/threonine-protein kinase/ABC transporter substrate-binding protein n=1 Tax=Phormidium sp. CCY1219 TaxID=2886104 RepID=UPI002D1F94AE|nr:bifunctional serine/threonine-protein kinase/ABC transporter substrate-binding protein [Phormidium sp. CCY1219]MEB3830538.1 ABC transporter substrate-binding protein [Phormidium sp. CCY1219]
MRYCINSHCSVPENPDNGLFCRHCGAQLLLNGRYWATRLLATRSLGGVLYSRTFEASDRNSPKILKVLYDTDDWAISRFRREAQVLRQLRDRGLPQVCEDGFFDSLLQQNLPPVHCLVMERIEGLNLLQWLEKRGDRPIGKPEETLAIAWLKQLTLILDRVHQQGFFHRDIKPSNIMLDAAGQLVLIDFGEVREVTPEEVTVVYTQGYTAPEQHDGFAGLPSDFFALGRTFVHLLTGQPPKHLSTHPTTRQLIWRNRTDISKPFADLIDDLMAFSPENRPQSSREILHRLEAICNSYNIGQNPDKIPPRYSETVPQKSPTKSRRIPWKLLSLGTGLVLGIAAIASGFYFRQKPPQFVTKTVANREMSPAAPLPSGREMNPQNCPPSLGDYLSCGEEILFQNSPISAAKTKGVQAFQNQDYDRAVELLEKARQEDPTDPETLIYLNNARIATQPAYTIAVVTPLSGSVTEALEILRGVAQAQDNLNQSQEKMRLRVLIADDGDRVELAKQIARSLVGLADILAAIGHCHSEITTAVADIYKNKLVTISATSSAAGLSQIGEDNEYLFRTVNSDAVTAKAMAHYVGQQEHLWKVAVFYNSNSDYSRSLLKEFQANFPTSQFQEMIPFDGGEHPWAIADGLSYIAQYRPDEVALVFLADRQMQQDALDAIAQVTQPPPRRGRKPPPPPGNPPPRSKKDRNRRPPKPPSYAIVGTENLYTPELTRTRADGVMVALPWNRECHRESAFYRQARFLWDRADVSWVAALSHDATVAAIAGLERHPQTREELQHILSENEFQAIGASGLIQFAPNGDRFGDAIEWLTIAPRHKGYEFVPVRCSTLQART